MKKVHRTLILTNNKDNSLIYGHCISWTLSELDYVSPDWKTYNKGKFSAHFKDLENIDDLENNLNTGTLEVDLEKFILKAILPDSEDFFIEQSHEESNFNPFISLCTFSKVHFADIGQNAKNPVDFITAHKSEFEDFKEKFHVDLPHNPHLIGSFSFFTPTRIEESFKGHNTPEFCGYEIHLHDYFRSYTGATVLTTAVAGEKIHEQSFNLDDKSRKVACGFVPDKQITIVKFDESTIYKSSFYLLKNIRVNTNIVTHKQIKSNGTTITQATSEKSKFDV